MKRQNLRTVSLIVVTFTYLLFGAAIFGYLESDHEVRQREALELIELIVKRKYNISEDDFSVLTTTVIKSVPHKAGIQWKFSGAFYFATTVVTTIGYGHSTPATMSGRLFCMIYALIGIPLGLVMFQSIGERLNTFVGSALRCVKRCFKVKNAEVTQTNLVMVVSVLSTILMTSMAAVFAKYEGWAYFDALYYCFITLTTIGFGDYVALQKDSALQSKPQYVALSLIFILFGLSVVSSAVNLLVLKFLTLNTEDERRDEQQRYNATLNPIQLEGDVITSPAGRLEYARAKVAPSRRANDDDDDDEDDADQVNADDNRNCNGKMVVGEQEDDEDDDGNDEVNLDGVQHRSRRRNRDPPADESRRLVRRRRRDFESSQFAVCCAGHEFEEVGEPRRAREYRPMCRQPYLASEFYTPYAECDLHRPHPAAVRRAPPWQANDLCAQHGGRILRNEQQRSSCYPGGPPLGIRCDDYRDVYSLDDHLFYDRPTPHSSAITIFQRQQQQQQRGLAGGAAGDFVDCRQQKIQLRPTSIVPLPFAAIQEYAPGGGSTRAAAQQRHQAPAERRLQPDDRITRPKTRYYKTKLRQEQPAKPRLSHMTSSCSCSGLSLLSAGPNAHSSADCEHQAASSCLVLNVGCLGHPQPASANHTPGHGDEQRADSDNHDNGSVFHSSSGPPRASSARHGQAVARSAGSSQAKGSCQMHGTHEQRQADRRPGKTSSGSDELPQQQKQQHQQRQQQQRRWRRASSVDSDRDQPQGGESEQRKRSSDPNSGIAQRRNANGAQRSKSTPKLICKCCCKHEECIRHALETSVVRDNKQLQADSSTIRNQQQQLDSPEAADSAPRVAPPNVGQLEASQPDAAEGRALSLDESETSLRDQSLRDTKPGGKQ